MRLVPFTAASLLCTLVLAVNACGERPGAKKSGVTFADVIAGTVKTFDHFESAEGGFAVDFPPVWKGNYVGIAHADTAFGSRFVLDFRFKPDPSWKVESRTLLAVRIFAAAAWDKASRRPGPAIGTKLTQRGDDVFVLSVVPSDPYKPGTPAAILFNQMMLAVVNDSVPLRVTPRVTSR